MKKALITGTATGLGRYLTEILLQRGWIVAAVTRTADKLSDLQNKFGQQMIVIETDISSASGCAEVLSAVKRAGFIPDLLINNAGYGQIGPVEAVDFESVRRQFDVNVFSVIEICRLLIPGMISNGGGRIIHVGSSAGKISSPFNGIYAATKHALEAVADAQRFELSAAAIDVVLLEPGKLDTDYNNKILSEGEKIKLSVPQRLRGHFENFLIREKNNKGASLQSMQKSLLAACESAHPPARMTFDTYTRVLFLLRRFLPARVYDLLVKSRNQL